VLHDNLCLLWLLALRRPRPHQQAHARASVLVGQGPGTGARSSRSSAERKGGGILSKFGGVSRI
jgi:hypothetical protein